MLPSLLSSSWLLSPLLYSPSSSSDDEADEPVDSAGGVLGVLVLVADGLKDDLILVSNGRLLFDGAGGVAAANACGIDGAVMMWMLLNMMDMNFKSSRTREYVVRLDGPRQHCCSPCRSLQTCCTHSLACCWNVFDCPTQLTVLHYGNTRRAQASRMAM